MNGPLPAWARQERLVLAAWSRIAEPEDELAALVRAHLGPVRAMRHVLAGEPVPVEVLLSAEGEGADEARARRRLRAGLDRWRVRAATAAPERDLTVIEGLGGRLVVPTDAEWPRRLDDLGHRAPACLWVRGPVPLAAAVERSVALVGARACTPYGEQVASTLALGAAERGVCVVSGGAFGIDAAAHRGALAATPTAPADRSGPTGGRGLTVPVAPTGPVDPSGSPDPTGQISTVAVLACGVDRDYPRAHDRLLARIREEGLVVSEAPPGNAVTRWRFLQRNRLIAALTQGTVVVEAAWRSGAVSTAGHAATLGRPLGAVPGPVTSPTSAGSHRVLREHGATCVTDVDELLELIDPLTAGASSAPGPSQQPGAPDRDPRAGARRAHDGLRDVDLRVYEALPIRSGRPVASLATVAGLPERDVTAALGRLALGRLALCDDTPDGHPRWRRHPDTTRSRPTGR